MSEKPQMIFQAMINIMKDVDPIAKDKKSDRQNYMFRGIDDMYNALHNLFAKHGVLPIPKVTGGTRKLIPREQKAPMVEQTLEVTYQFFAADGSSIEASVCGEAIDVSDKATNKAMSQALKYALMQIFLIPTEETEGDGDIEKEDHNRPEQKQKKQSPKIQKVELKADSKQYSQVLKKVMSGEVSIQSIKEYFILPGQVEQKLKEAEIIASA